MNDQGLFTIDVSKGDGDSEMGTIGTCRKQLENDLKEGWKELNQNHNRHLPGIPDQEVHECPGNEVLARISSELLSLQLLCLMLSMFFVQKENHVMSIVDERCCLLYQ